MDFNDRSELEGLAPTLAAMAKANPFVVPERYFGNLQEQLNSRAKLEEITISNGFIVPDKYFEDLASGIQNGVFLESIREKNLSQGFTVPANYFPDLTQRITDKLEIKKPASKVIKLRFIQYAAAACITMAIGTGIFFNNYYSPAKVAQTAISEIPDEEIISYLQSHIDAADTPVILEHLQATNGDMPSVGDDLTEDELQHYLNTTL